MSNTCEPCNGKGWNFREEICAKEAGFLKRGGKFITHVPLVNFIFYKDTNKKIF